MNHERRMTAEPRSKKQNLSAFRKLASYLMRYRKLLFLALALTALSNAAALLAPSLVGQAVGYIELGKQHVNLDGVIATCGLLLLCYLGHYLFSVGLSYTMMTLGQRLGYTLRRDSFAKFENVPISYFDTHQAGNTISRFTYDVDLVSTSVGQQFITFSTAFITLIGSFIMMYFISPTLMTVFLITVPLSMGIGVFCTKRARAFHREKSKRTGEVNGYVEDKITGHKTIKIYGQEKQALSGLREKNDLWSKAQYRAQFVGAGTMRSSFMFLSNTTTAIIYVHGCILLLSGQITLGEIASFLIYAKLFTGVVNEISTIIADLQSGLAAAERVFEWMEEKEERPDSPQDAILTDFEGDVRLSHIGFHYHPEREILHNISIQAQAGQTIALVGHTGAGKTTLINLLMRFYYPNEGAIFFGDHNIQHVTRDSLRSSCAMVLQEAWLFGGTIFENIAYGKEDATLENVISVSKAVSLHNHVMGLPHGYETIMSDDSSNISQGQRQLMTIARAMLLDAKVLILDEATSNVDTITEMNIQRSLSQLSQGKTSFIIAHRLSTVRNAHCIVVLNQGQIIEQGTHEELLALKGHYATLYESQFQVHQETT